MPYVLLKLDILFSSHSSCFLIYQKPVQNLVNQLYKSLEPEVYPIICYNGAPVLSKNGIYFSKAMRSYGNILLWGIVVVSVVLSPFIMILWHLREDTLWGIPTQRLMPDSVYTFCVHTHTYWCTHASMYAYIWAQRPGRTVPTQQVCAHKHILYHTFIYTW